MFSFFLCWIRLHYSTYRLIVSIYKCLLLNPKIHIIIPKFKFRGEYMHEVDLASIGRRIQNRRKQKGYTQEQLAEMMNVSIQMVSNLERGNKAVRIDNLINLSQILDISTDYILTGKETTDDIQSLTARIAQLSGKERKMVEILVDFCILENK